MLLVEEKAFSYIEPNATPRVYIDLDGTLFDFFRYFANLNYFDMRSKGITISEISPEIYRKKASIRRYMHKRMANNKIDYWCRVPKTKCADILWSSLRQLEPFIFTGVISGDTTMEMGKMKWCRKKSHLNFKNRDLCRILINKNRKEYANNNGCPNILIDDDSENCLEWEKAGGIAYYYMDNQLVVSRIVSEVRADVIRNNDIEFLKIWDPKLQAHCF